MKINTIIIILIVLVLLVMIYLTWALGGFNWVGNLFNKFEKNVLDFFGSSGHNY